MSSNSISFIIPVYNASKYLEECVASIVPQIDDGDEIILVNDGSTDSSPEICERLASENPGIRLINKANGGVSSARNTGIDSAKNEWLYFIDADDKLFPKAVEEMKKAAEQGGELIIGGYTSGETPAPRNGKETRLSCEDMISLLLCYPRHMNIVSEECRFEGMGLWPCWGKLFKRETVLSNNIRFSEELFLGEDLLFNLQYIQHINSGTAINSEMYFYRLNNSSVTSRFQSKELSTPYLFATNFGQMLMSKQTRSTSRI